MGQTQMLVDHTDLKKFAMKSALDFYGNKGCNFEQLLYAAEKVYQWLSEEDNG